MNLALVSKIIFWKISFQKF